jgi:hypothetical protein
MNGLTAAAGLVQLVREIEAILWVEFLQVAMPPSVEFRPGATEQLRTYADLARTAQPPGDSFTETFVGVAEQHGDVEAALAVIGYHQPLADARDRVVLDRESLTEASVTRLIDETPQDEMLVVTSRVGVAGGTAHLPLLDFKMAAEDRNLSVARSVVGLAGGGLLVNSGSSFHLYGDRLLDDTGMREWLLRAQLLSRCVDTRWVTHQLLEGKAALRLTKGGGRNQVPVVVERIDVPERMRAGGWVSARTSR